MLTSFDVFDTLITRTWFRPTDLFLAVATRLVAEGLHTGSAEEWCASRIEAEVQARAASSFEEVTIDEIYAVLARNSGWSPAVLSRAMSLELAEELKSTRPISGTLDSVRHLESDGADVVLISDTYFDKPFVLSLLLRSGFEIDESKLHVSSQTRTTKRTGSLFVEIAQRLGIETSAIRHLGDNRESDWRSAKRVGVQARLFEEPEPNRFEKQLFEGDGAPLMLRSAFAGASRVVRLRHANDGLEALWRVSANVAGPVVFAYVLWMLLESRERGIRRLYFLARDGQILLKVARVIVAWLGLDIDCRYLHASRQALFLPSLDTLDASSEPWLRDILGQGTLRQIADRVRVDVDTLVSGWLDSGGKVPSPDHVLSEAEHRQLVRSFVTYQSLSDPLLSSAAKRRDDLLAYLRQEGLADGTSFAIVDLGWKGRLQQALSRVLSNGAMLPPGGLTGFYYALSVSTPSDAGAFVEFTTIDRISNAVLLETFCAADHGTTRSFHAAGEGRVEPLLAEPVNEAALAWGLKGQQSAIEAFATTLTSMLDAETTDARALSLHARMAALGAFARLTREPASDEAQIYGSFGHAEDQAHSGEADLAPKFSRMEALRWLCAPRRFTRQVSHWPEASFARSGETAAARTLFLGGWKFRATFAKVRGAYAK